MRYAVLAACPDQRRDARRLLPKASSIRKGRSRRRERLLLINSTAIMLVVVVPVILATLAFAWWYRSSNPRASRSPDLSL